MASTGDAQALSSRVWTVPNVISMLRLALVPVFAWPIPTEQDVAAVVVLIVAGASDWFDGVIARRFDQMSRLGQLLDPAADRLYILVTLIGLGSRGFCVAPLLGEHLAARILNQPSPLPRAAEHRLSPKRFAGD